MACANCGKPTNPPKPALSFCTMSCARKYFAKKKGK